MHDDCPACGLDFDRGDPGHFTGAMYVSYALAIPLLALLTLIEHLILPGWSLFRLVVLASLLCVPLIPWLWQYSRVIWIYFDRYFDPDDAPDQAAPGHPHVDEGPWQRPDEGEPPGTPANGHLD
jgi:hypothetical protein